MNNYILKNFPWKLKYCGLPHQLATIDWIDKKFEKEDRLYLFHYMGTGKTVVILLYVILYIIKYPTNKVLILLPSLNIVNIWKEMLYNIILPMYSLNVNLINISFFSSELSIAQNYDLIIIDEAHKMYKSMVQLCETLADKKCILVSGSPITNTIKDFIPIAYYFGYRDKIINNKNLVIDIELDKNHLENLAKSFKDKISFYSDLNANAKIKFEGQSITKYFSKTDLDLKIVECPMSDLQNADYEYIKEIEDPKLFMFSNKFINVSLGALNNRIFNIESDKTIVLYKQTNDTGGLVYNNGKLHGTELKLLNISSKLKFFIDTLKNGTSLGKHFVFFRNVRYGTILIENVLKNNGITRYKELPNDDFLCVNCGDKRSCKKCIPMNFIIITGRVNINDIQEKINAFNSIFNKNGEIINIFIGSEIISESYSFKEIKNFWLFTIPDTRGKFNQTAYRIIRQFSHEKKTTIKGYILVAIPKSELCFDLQKIKYLILKEENLLIGEKMLKNSSEIYSNVPTNNTIKEMLFMNYIRHYFINEYIINDVNKWLNSIKIDFLKYSEKETLFNKYIDKSITVYNSQMGLCILKNINNNIYSIPYIIKLPSFRINIPCLEIEYNWVFIENNLLIYKKSIYSLDNLPENIKKILLDNYEIDEDNFKESLIELFKKLNSNHKIFYKNRYNNISTKINITKQNDVYYLTYKKQKIINRKINSLKKEILLEIINDYKIPINSNNIKHIIESIIEYLKLISTEDELFYIEI